MTSYVTWRHFHPLKYLLLVFQIKLSPTFKTELHESKKFARPEFCRSKNLLSMRTTSFLISFLENGADVTLENDEGKSALQITNEHGKAKGKDSLSQNTYNF